MPAKAHRHQLKLVIVGFQIVILGLDPRTHLLCLGMGPRVKPEDDDLEPEDDDLEPEDDKRGGDQEW